MTRDHTNAIAERATSVPGSRACSSRPLSSTPPPTKVSRRRSALRRALARLGRSARAEALSSSDAPWSLGHGAPASVGGPRVSAIETGPSSDASEPQCFREVIDGVELHWSVRGKGSNVVVLHGLSDSERSWWPVMAELGRHHRVFGLDLPGCGLSGRPDASYSLDWHAKLVAAWLDRLGITTCDVIGHSFGGGVAMWLLLYRARAIRRLALVAPGGLGREVAIELRLASLPLVVERCG